MNLLFLSQLYPDSLIPELLKNSKIGLDWAAHNLCQALIDGFRRNKVEPLMVNVPHVGSWPPFYRSIKVSGTCEKHLDSIAFTNIAYLKRHSVRTNAAAAIDRWCKENQGEGIILFYNFELLPLLSSIKRNHPKVKAVLLVTDLPQYDTASPNIFTRINNAFFRPPTPESTHALLDGYILLAPGMAEHLPMGSRPWIHMEGIYNQSAQELESPPATVNSSPATKTIVYTGTLGERYGIRRLLDAFALIDDPNYRLIIRGNGTLESLVRERMMTDSRISAPARMERGELILMQRQATLLINPVSKDEEFTRFFFPSKTLEYMASGTPTLMSRLSCLPKGYEDHLFFFDDESTEGMAETIRRICEKPQKELDDFGREAAQYILQEKTPQPQTRRILDFFLQL